MLFILFWNVRGKKYMQREDTMVIRENGKAYRCQVQIYLCTLLMGGAVSSCSYFMAKVLHYKRYVLL
jgi:hypothetical protein